MTKQDALLTDFLDFLQSERTYALNSLQAYLCDSRQFIEFCRERFPKLEAPDSSHVAAFHDSLNEKGFGSRTISRKLSSAAKLADFCVRKSAAGSAGILDWFALANGRSQKGASFSGTCAKNESGGGIVDLLGAFLRWVKERNSSENTVRAYKRDLGELGDFVSNDVHRLTGSLQQYFFELEQHKLSPATVKRKLACVRSFCAWLVRNSIIEKNPAEGIQLSLVVLDKHSFGIKSEDVELLRSKQEDLAVFPERESLIVELLYSLGLRPSEIVNLEMSDVDLRKDLLRVRNERSERFLPISTTQLKRKFKKYLRKRNHIVERKNGVEALIINSKGTRLTTRSIHRNLRHAASTLGIATGLRPSTLRQAYAKKAISAGQNPIIALDKLGLSSGITRYRNNQKTKRSRK